MLTSQQNERLTRVGPGMPGGELLRRYWQPLCPVAELTDKKPKKRVRIMCEDLVAFRDGDGQIGVVQEHCAHRGASLYYGFVEKGGIRCAYHGWKYDRAGRCVDTPFEPRTSPICKEVRLRSYPVQILSGLIFVYMGPDPEQAPLLPRWDVLVRRDGRRRIQIRPEHRCNWLQIQENTVDLTHTFYLHGHMNEVHGLELNGADYYYRPIVRFDWRVCEWGIEKELEYGGDNPEIEIRPPLVFPNILRIPAGPVDSIHWRVPIDDTHTRIVWVGFMPSKDGSIEMADGENPDFIYTDDGLTEDGEYDLQNFNSHDQMACETQGAIFDRSHEYLGVTDRGIVMFRRMLEEQISRVERGEFPTVAVVRDPKKNESISFPSMTRPTGDRAGQTVFDLYRDNRTTK
jgi:5,5'-dehydrodivanillate O-demethylase